MNAVQRELVEQIERLDESQQRAVLDFVLSLQSAPHRRLSAREIMRLPHEERRRVVEAALRSADNEDFETFEAYSEEDLDDAD